ncbi:phytoene/squalene synthase family protein [Opacimonas viscosa]|uniref:Phytoene/squalene synthase family protein n=1 Tax=Opacimonas viscosa TaxID=2961944 RepID=A0AA42BLI6_9ALTE|nr:phytoene/squalene synthase family protein [Opacimonas viscosa]MCP3428845.1 phytoene/squalene synthase family protein [Opacimonas viscosa]
MASKGYYDSIIAEKIPVLADEAPATSNSSKDVERQGVLSGNSNNFDSQSDFLATLASFANAQETLAVNGKSFRFAQHFLSKKTGQAAAQLYQFCRICDDLVDEAPSETHASSRIQCLLKYLDIMSENINAARGQQYQSFPDALITFFKLKQEYDLPQSAIHQLLVGIQSDLTEKVKITETDLLIYCYRVAGTVGELMCPILEAPDVAKPYAMDLGIAMQLTNIARDVLEDAQNGRIYLPQEWLGGMSVNTILYPSPSQKIIICAAIKRCLTLAEDYYFSALQGLQSVPWRNRIAMHQALFIYREIGLVLAEKEFDYQVGRIYVPIWDKLFVVLRHSYKLMLPPTVEPHESSLHKSFRSLYAKSSN